MSSEPKTPFAIKCHACKVTMQPLEVVKTQSYTPGGVAVNIELLRNQCTSCGREFTTHSLHMENLKRLAARKSHYGKYPMTEEYLQFRTYYGLTSEQAAQLFSVTPRTYTRYENEKSYPRGAALVLIALTLKYPHALKFIADISGVCIPLWEDRMEVFESIKENEAEKRKLLKKHGIALDFAKLQE